MDELGALLMVSSAGGNVTLEDADAVSLRDRGLAYVGLSDGNGHRVVRALTPAGLRRLRRLSREALRLALEIVDGSTIYDGREIAGVTWQRRCADGWRWYAASAEALVCLGQLVLARGDTSIASIVETWIAEREHFESEGRAALSIGLDV